MAGLATPLVISVHSVVSSDFAISLEPGWHETVFPPYFVAGALLSGFAMVIALAIPMRHYYGVEDFISLSHLEVMAKILLATSFFTSYGYFSEQFITWISGETYDKYVYLNILIGFRQYAVITWITLLLRVHRPATACGFTRFRTKRKGAVCRLGAGAGRDVDGAVPAHHDEPQPRFSPVVVGHLPADDLGHPHVFGIAGAVRRHVFVLLPLPADDFDVRNARPAAGCPRARGGAMKPEPDQNCSA